MSILQEADALINGDRQKDYGDPLTNFTRISRLWSVLLETEVSPEQVAMCMIAVKMARSMNKLTHDSLTDIAGYAGVIELIQGARDKRA